jgi:hypothetical protein
VTQGLSTRRPAASRRRAGLALVALCAIAWSASARGADPASGDARADQIQFAAHEHDLGYRAFVDKRYEEAATHFENAFFVAPNPAELRSAIRARREAGDLARAATLAAIGERKFPADEITTKLADEVIAQARGTVYEVRLASEEMCSVAVDGKVVTNERLKDFQFFVSPGAHEVLVSWSDDRSERVPIQAAPGESQTLTFRPAPVQAPVPVPVPVPVPAPAPALAPRPGSTKPFGPAVCLSGAAVTAVGVGLTVWSGVDTLNNPGRDAVRRGCVGFGPSCPKYQQGLSAQLRTNVLLAATGGLAVVSAAVGVFFTQWSGAERSQSGAVRLVPVVGLGQAAMQGSF